MSVNICIIWVFFILKLETFYSYNYVDDDIDKNKDLFNVNSFNLSNLNVWKIMGNILNFLSKNSRVKKSSFSLKFIVQFYYSFGSVSYNILGLSFGNYFVLSP